MIAVGSRMPEPGVMSGDVSCESSDPQKTQNLDNDLITGALSIGPYPEVF